MVKKNCQNCKKVIGDDGDSCSHYGYVICKSCKTKVEKLYQFPNQVTSVANDNVATETPIMELEFKPKREATYQAPVAKAKEQTWAEDAQIESLLPQESKRWWETDDRQGEDTPSVSRNIYEEVRAPAQESQPEVISPSRVNECANCEGTIENPESTRQFKGHTVCVECFGILEVQKQIQAADQSTSDQVRMPTNETPQQVVPPSPVNECTRCGGTIENPESAREFESHVVCVECFGKLQSREQIQAVGRNTFQEVQVSADETQPPVVLSNQVSKCGTCEKTIEDPESTHEFEGRVVCTECFESRKQTPVVDTAAVKKARTQVKIGLGFALIIVTGLTSSLVAGMLYDSWDSFGVEFLGVMLFVTYVLGLLKKDSRTARRAYRTCFALWFLACATVVSLLTFLIPNFHNVYGVSLQECIGISLFCVMGIAFSASALLLLRTGANGLSKIPEAKNKSSRAPLLYWAIVPFLGAIVALPLSMSEPAMALLASWLRQIPLPI
jgi:hypothetical protein